MEVCVKVEPLCDEELDADGDHHGATGHVLEARQASDTLSALNKKEVSNATDESQNILNNDVDATEKSKHIKLEIDEEKVDKNEAPNFEDSLNLKKVAQDVRAESLLEELYANCVVKDELVLSPEAVQKPRKARQSDEPSPLTCDVDTAKHHKHQCDICGKVYQRKHFLVSHIKMHSKYNNKAHTCKLCKKVFSIRSGLNRHELSHTGAKPLTCEICNKKFAQIGHLTDHKLTHTEERPHACNMCSKQFKRSTHLIVHKRSHTGEKPYSCEYCEKKFKSSGGLVSHRRIHTGEKAQHTCDICKKTFMSNRDLTRHQRVHTGEKPYVCEICKKAYKQDAHLKTHLKVHTGDS